MLKGIRCLVTGASGFIGRHLCRALSAAGASVTALGRGERPDDELGAHVMRWVRCDLSDPVAVERAAGSLGGQDVFFHAAGCLDESRSLGDLRQRYFAEVVAPLTLADRAGDGDGMIVLLSSVAVYGPGEGVHDENSPLAPGGLYGVNKAVLEDALGLFARLGKRPLAILRIASVYGPGMSAKFAIPNFISRISRGVRPAVTGPPWALRDYVAVSDVVRACMAVAGKRVGGVFNIASGAPLGLADMGRAVARAMGSDLEPEIRSSSQGPDRSYPIDRARREFGFDPLDIEQGLREMVAGEGGR